MKKLVTFRWSLIVPVGTLLFWCLDVSAQSQDDKDASFAKYALKLREDVLQRVSTHQSLTKTTFTGSGTGYGSGTSNRSDAHYPALTPFPSVSGSRVLMVGDSMTVGGFGGGNAGLSLAAFWEREMSPCTLLAGHHRSTGSGRVRISSQSVAIGNRLRARPFSAISRMANSLNRLSRRSWKIWLKRFILRR